MYIPNLSAILMVFIVIFAFYFYFLPTFIVVIRKKTNRLPVFVINLLAGWTLIGWIIAMVWGATSDTAPAKKDSQV